MIYSSQGKLHASAYDEIAVRTHRTHPDGLPVTTQVAGTSDQRLTPRPVVKQIKGEYQVKNEGIRLLYDSALRWIAHIPRFSIEHVRRENNKDADKLANLAMDTRRNSVKWE